MTWSRHPQDRFQRRRVIQVDSAVVGSVEQQCHPFGAEQKFGGRSALRRQVITQLVDRLLERLRGKPKRPMMDGDRVAGLQVIVCVYGVDWIRVNRAMERSRLVSTDR